MDIPEGSGVTQADLRRLAAIERAGYAAAIAVVEEEQQEQPDLTVDELLAHLRQKRDVK